MKAAVLSKVGGPLVIEDIPQPRPKAGEVLVKVAAWGVRTAHRRASSTRFLTAQALWL